MVETFGLSVWHGAVQSMSNVHQHYEIELNFVEQGTMIYLFGAKQFRFTTGQFALFWGAIPHQLIDFEPNTQCYWVTIPLAHFLRWGIADTFTARLLEGTPLFSEHDPQSQFDRGSFQQWSHDWLQDDAEYRTIVLLEIEARLRRFALAHATRPPSDSKMLHPNTMLNHKVDMMIQLIAEHYTEVLSVPDIAKSVGLHPKYAIQLFKRSIGIGLIDYLTQHRLAHAQRLLATTSLNVIDIALESGFGSPSRFYAVFKREYGMSPHIYRSSVTR